MRRYCWRWLVVLIPADYREMLGTHGVFSLAFAQRKFWREGGYFDAASHEKWFAAHLVAGGGMKVYLLLPLALLAVWGNCARPKVRRRPAMTVGLLVSLARLTGGVTWLNP